MEYFIGDIALTVLLIIGIPLSIFSLVTGWPHGMGYKYV